MSSADGTTVGAFVRNVEDVTVSGGGVAFVGLRTTPASLAYVSLVPSVPRVDGAFGEWANATPDPVGDVTPVADRDVDLNAYGFRGFSGSTYFMASVAGAALNGTMVPDLNPAYAPASGGAGNGTVGPPPPPVNGTDSIRFFLDTDGNSSTGYRIGGLGADYLVEITGKGGLILSSLGMRFNGASPYDWKWSSVGTAQAAKDESHIETVLAGVPITNISRAYFEASAWNGANDNSGPPNSPLAVLSVVSTQRSSVNAQSATAPNPSGSFNLQAQVLSGNQQWFFIHTTPTAGNPSDCSPTANNWATSTTAGSAATNTVLNNGNSICWYTPAQTPSEIAAGPWEFNLDISSTGTSPQYRTQLFHCATLSCGTAGQTLLYDANYTLFGTNVSIVTPTIPAQLLGSTDRIEFKIAQNGASGSTVKINYNGLSPNPGTSDSWASLPLYQSNEQWFFTNQSPTGSGNPSDCSPAANNFGAALNPGTGPAATTLASGQSTCWYTPPGSPVSTSAGAWQLSLDLSSAGTNPKYRIQIYHCASNGCSPLSQTLLFDANYTTFGNNVTITTSTIPAQTLGASDRIEWKISWNGGSGSTVTINYNGPSPNPGTSDSWASVSIPEFGDAFVPIVSTMVLSLAVGLCRRKRKG